VVGRVAAREQDAAVARERQRKDVAAMCAVVLEPLRTTGPMRQRYCAGGAADCNELALDTDAPDGPVRLRDAECGR
jgi:hypothetical protein